MIRIWRLAFYRMTQKVDFCQTTVLSMILAGSATVVAAPYFYFLLFDVLQSKTPDITDPYQVLTLQLGILFIVCLLSSFAGISLGPRYQLPVFGDLQDFKSDLPFMLILGFFLMGLSFLFFDRYFYRISPVSYPSQFLFLVSIPLKGAITGEIILRLGLVTIGAGICKNRMGGVCLVSVFSTFLSIKYLYFAGIQMSLSYIFIVQILLTFLINMILGLLYVSRGLLHAMTVKFVFNLKCLLIVWVM